MRTAFLLALLGVTWIALGCASSRIEVPVRPPPALLFEFISAPAQTNFGGTPVGKKSATGTLHYLQDPILTNLPIITWGEAGVEAIAADAGIEEVHFVDYGIVSVLGVYVELRVYVSGD